MRSRFQGEDMSMTKPDWCPQRVWDDAVEAVGSPDVYVGRLSTQVMYEQVAHALLTALQETQK